MELRHLRYFVAVANEGHITRAAERLGIQQPPLSLQIKAMEREVGAQLFRRKPRGVELTDAGRALLEDARAMLAHHDRALDTTRRTARGEQGRLSLGIAPTAPFLPFVPRVIRAFREAFPRVSCTLEEGLSNVVREGLLGGTMDVAFVRTATLNDPALVVHLLLEEDMVVALPRGHALAQGRRGAALALKALADDPFILFGPPGTGIYDETVAACRAAGFTPKIGQLAPRITSTLGLVAAGLGVAIVPAALENMTLDGVSYRALKGAVRPTSVLGIAARKNDPSALVRQFTTFVRRAAKSL